MGIWGVHFCSSNRSFVPVHGKITLQEQCPKRKPTYSDNAGVHHFEKITQDLCMVIADRYTLMSIIFMGLINNFKCFFSLKLGICGCN